MDSADDKITLFANQTSEQDIFETKYKNIVIVRNASKNNLSSSKIKLKNIVDYSWEVKTYNGRLVAGHKDGKLIAYSIRAKNKGKYEGMIRIVNVENGKRALIKGVYNETIDLEFAYLTEPVLLAYINESTLFIQKIVECNDNLETSLIFQINDVIEHNINHDKVTWCPYIPESTCENDLYASQLVTWSRGTTFQCYNICFSPDGTTLAASTEDGFVRFYQIYLHSIDGPPRRLHEWKPHDGKAVKKILFLDNLKQNTTDEPLWKNAVTYSEELQEIKLWCCETWNCIQCITFQNIRDIPFHLNIGIDKTASYLILSDMNTQQVYAFCIEKCNLEEKTSFKTVIRFPVSSPILSFDIVYASLQRYKSSLCDTYFGQDIDEYDDETCPVLCILKMFIVQPKSVQECNFLYCPSSTKSLNINIDLKHTN
uniref:CSON006973 protein n=1 Tax=Culicoides sonorensis TaxID=179676 RepID=A0A336M137_CULSO